ncbi:MAG: ornithine carbamoyltransferase [Acidobacteria bacterium]|nr:ornithine carbamoyltransferase [Acidobacteriota bacterium]
MATSLVEQPILKMSAPDLRGDLDLTVEETRRLLELAIDLKRNASAYATALQGRSLSLLFEKPSLRTRLTFELAIQQLGGYAVSSIGMIGDREPLKDVARNLDRWTQGIVARVFSQETIEGLAQWSRVPVINALSDLYHPCQALADVQTVLERFGHFEGLKLAYIGDGNNMAHSLLLTAGRLGMHVAIAAPNGYGPNPDVLSAAANAGVQYTLTSDPAEAANGAHVVYTDVWASMGQETEAEERKRVFAGFQVDDVLMAQTARNAIFLHCLPAKRGQEVTDSVMESAQSAIFDQAENRLHAQKALLLMLLR